MRKQLLYIVFFVGTITHMDSQNLVPNPGFENLTSCPDDDGQIGLAIPWSHWLTPDLYHTCGYFPFLRPPKVRVCDHVEPHSGDAFAGLYVLGPGGREYMETELLETLEKDEMYYARFYVLTDDDCELGAPTTYTDAIALGVGIKGLYHEIAAENRGTIISDTMNWKPVGGCYSAKGGESNLQIKNFYPDSETELVAIPSGESVYFNYFFIDDVSLHHVAILPDTLLLCPDESLELDASFLDANYQWSTGDTSDVIQIYEPGTYFVQVSLEGCTITDTVRVLNPELPYSQLPDTVICDDRSIVIPAPLPGVYQWSNGANTSSIQVNQGGEYRLTVTNECGDFVFKKLVDDENCKCRVYIPNAFSPNDDGKNDFLDVFMKCKYPSEVNRFAIYDKWGGEIFSTNDLSAMRWDGKIQGEMVPTGVYTWYLDYTTQPDGETRKITESGHVNLIR